MQFGGGGVPPVGVLFDASFDHVGDLFALAVMHGLEVKNEMRQTALSVNRADFQAAQFCDFVQRFYNPGAFIVPAVGMSSGQPRALPVFGTILAKKNDDGMALFKPNLKSVLDTADPATLLRNALTASQPKNSIIVAAGSLSSLTRLIALRGARDVIAGTVKHLVIAAPAGANDAAAAARLFAEWPSPIYLCGAEIGEAVRFPAASAEKDFAAPAPHPLGEAYREFSQPPYDTPAQSMSAILFAVRSKSDYFKLSDPGTLRLSSAGSLEIAPSAEGAHRRVLLDESRKDDLARDLAELAAAPPRAAGRRGARGAADVPPPVKKQ
jgi:hypothetical protein